jgi:energy-coupling factor transporter ATP-binding protein EcfA2
MTNLSVRYTMNDGAIHVLGRYHQIKAEMSAPHEVMRKRYPTATTAVEMKVSGGELVGTWNDVSDDEQSVLWKVGADAWVQANSLWNNMSLYVLVDDSNGWERCHALLDQIIESLPILEKPPDGTVNMEFWYWAGTAACSRTRGIVVPKWDDIKGNYASKSREALSHLMELRPASIETGRIMLLHGPAGTGKTTAIRALADAWKSWCDLVYVVDADDMFMRGGYLMQVLLSEAIGDRWRLVIVEDAEEFLTPDAKKNVGQAIARLLNLGDGMIGQGLNVLVLMTTNAPIVKLHEAIMRPGRCIANIEVPRMSASEASQWSEGNVHGEATLAELFEAQRQSQIGSGISDARAGVYL